MALTAVGTAGGALFLNAAAGCIYGALDSSWNMLGLGGSTKMRMAAVADGTVQMANVTIVIEAPVTVVGTETYTYMAETTSPAAGMNAAPTDSNATPTDTNAAPTDTSSGSVTDPNTNGFPGSGTNLTNGTNSTDSTNSTNSVGAQRYILKHRVPFALSVADGDNVPVLTNSTSVSTLDLIDIKGPTPATKISSEENNLDARRVREPKPAKPHTTKVKTPKPTTFQSATSTMKQSDSPSDQGSSATGTNTDTVGAVVSSQLPPMQKGPGNSSSIAAHATGNGTAAGPACKALNKSIISSLMQLDQGSEGNMTSISDSLGSGAGTATMTASAATGQSSGGAHRNHVPATGSKGSTRRSGRHHTTRSS